MTINILNLKNCPKYDAMTQVTFLEAGAEAFPQTVFTLYLMLITGLDQETSFLFFHGDVKVHSLYY